MRHIKPMTVAKAQDNTEDVLQVISQVLTLISQLMNVLGKGLAPAWRP